MKCQVRDGMFVCFCFCWFFFFFVISRSLVPSWVLKLNVWLHLLKKQASRSFNLLLIFFLYLT